VIRVGGATEVELRERKDRVEDALHATQAAIEEGVVSGGGVALVRASKDMKDVIQRNNDDFNCGVQIVKRSCLEPLSQIVKNAGGSHEVVIDKVIRMKDNRGYDARNGEFVDMLASGIIDPVKVVRSALHHASSAACNLLSIGCAMVQDDSEPIEESNSLFNAL
jgi:chaperonin GroEL